MASMMQLKEKRGAGDAPQQNRLLVAEEKKPNEITRPRTRTRNKQRQSVRPRIAGIPKQVTPMKRTHSTRSPRFC